MATLYIAEFLGVAAVGTPVTLGPADAQIGGTPPQAEQTVSIGGASVPSAAFGSRTRMVRIHTDAICSIAWGQSPVATTVNMRLAANQTEFFGVTPGFKVAVIANV